MDTLYKQKVMIVFNQAKARARKSADRVKIIQRLDKALGILQSLDYYQNEKAQYQPTYYSCNCPDWKYHLAARRGYKGQCKHQIAMILMERINRLTYRQLDFFNVVRS